jgi:hypothetical protein
MQYLNIDLPAKAEDIIDSGKRHFKPPETFFNHLKNTKRTDFLELVMFKGSFF